MDGDKELAKKNPFRYRGYYYDEEIGLYYLNSRYYDAEVGRFVNEDDVTLIPLMQSGIKGTNLFEYCEDNPVNKDDLTGQWSISRRTIKKALMRFIYYVCNFSAFINLMISFFKWVVKRPFIRGILDGMKIARAGSSTYDKAVVIGIKIQNTIYRWKTAIKTAWRSLSLSKKIGIAALIGISVTIICYAVYKCRKR